MKLKLGKVTDTTAIIELKRVPKKVLVNPEIICVDITPPHGTVEVDIKKSIIAVSGLKPYTNYAITLTAESEHLDHDFRTKLAPPKISDVSSNDYINLKWSSVHKMDSVKFGLEYSINGGKWVKISVTGLSHKIENLKLGDTCVAKVKTLYSGESSELTEPYNAKTIVPVPRNFSVSNYNLGEVRASWTPVLKEMGTTYNIRVCESGIFFDGEPYTFKPSSEKIIIPNLKCDTEYKFSVKAIVDVFESEWADDYTITTSKVVPPEGIKSAETTDSAIVVKWDKIENSDVTYEVEYWKKSFFDLLAKSEIISTTTNSVTICGLKSDTAYKARVRSLFRGNKSVWSDNCEFKTLNPPPFKRPKSN